MDWRTADIGYALPQVFTETEVDIGVVRDVAIAADEAGLHSVWTQSQVTGQARVLEPISQLSYVAAITSQIRLGCMTINITEHTPVQLAKQLSSLDNLSAGRVIVGLGLGAPALRLQMDGFDMDRPVRRLLESIDIMRALWADGPAEVDGEIWRIHGEEMNPKPVQQPRPPMWLSGKVEAALARAVRVGDGWMGAGGYSTEQFEQLVTQLRSLVAQAGRNERDFVIAKRVYVAIEDRPEIAEDRLSARFGAYSRNGGDSTRVCVYGTADEVSAGLQRIVDAGAQLIVLNPVYDFVRQQAALLELAGR